MRGLFMSVHLFSILLILILVGVYAPIFWSITALVLFGSSLYVCEVCKKNASKTVSEASKHIKKATLSKYGLLVLSKTEKTMLNLHKKNKNK